MLVLEEFEICGTKFIQHLDEKYLLGQPLDLYQPSVLTRGLVSIGLHIEIIGNLA
jgi:hypothetical protein